MREKTRWLSSDEQQMWRSFLAMSRLLFAQLDADLAREFGMQAPAYGVLVRLSEAPSHTLRMSELADLEHFSRSRLSHAITRLEDLGWVERMTCESDKRGSYAVLTDHGYEVLKSAAPTHVEGVRKYLFDSLTSEQVDQLRTIAEAVLAGLTCPEESGEQD